MTLEERVETLERELAEIKALLQSPTAKPLAGMGYTQDFEEFWRAYPKNPNMSKAKAAQSYAKALRVTNAAEILSGVKGYKAWLQEPKQKDHPIAHATTWLNEWRWQGFCILGQVENPNLCTVVKGSREWDLWVAHRKANGLTFNPDKITVPSLLPPEQNGSLL